MEFWHSVIFGFTSILSRHSNLLMGNIFRVLDDLTGKMKFRQLDKHVNISKLLLIVYHLFITF